MMSRNAPEDVCQGSNFDRIMAGDNLVELAI